MQCEVTCVSEMSFFVYMCLPVGRVWPLGSDQMVSPEKRSVSSNSCYLVSDHVCVFTLTMPCATLVYGHVGMDDGGHCPSLSSLSFPLNPSSFFPGSFPSQVKLQSASLAWC